MHCFVFFLSVFSVSHEKSNTNLIVIFYRWPFFSWRFSPLYPQYSLMFEDTSQHGYCIQQQNTVEGVQTLSCVPDVEFWLWHLPFPEGAKVMTEILILKALYQAFSSVQLLSHVWLFATPWTASRQAFLLITNSWSYQNSHPLSRWCHQTISSSHLQSFPASGSFQMSQLVASGGQNIGVSASTSDLPMNTQDWSPLGWTDWISLQPNGLSRVFSSTTAQKHQFFSAQLFFIVQFSYPYMTTGKMIA